MIARRVSVLLLLLALPSLAAAQGRMANAKTETRSAAQGLEREVRAVAARGGVTWIGYRVPMVAGPRQMCCFDTISDSTVSGGMCRLESGSGVSMNTGDIRDRSGSRISLEPSTEFLVLARLENGSVSRLRTFTPDCDLDAGGMAVIWMNDVKTDDSLAWLASLVASSPESGDIKERVGKTAMTAVALHNVPAADRVLEGFVAPARPEWLRADTAFWLGNARGEAGARLLTRMIAQDPSDKVRDKVAFGLSVSKVPSALTTLIAAARDDKSTRVRSQALFWLAQKAGKEALATITGAIDNDPHTQGKKKEGFPLSRCPKKKGGLKRWEAPATNPKPGGPKGRFFGSVSPKTRAP